MYYDLSKVSTAIAYKLLAATVVPRPIAWVVTKRHRGRAERRTLQLFQRHGVSPAYRCHRPLGRS